MSVLVEVAGDTPFISSCVVLLGSFHLCFLQAALLQFPTLWCLQTQAAILLSVDCHRGKHVLIQKRCFCSPHLKCEHICLLFCMEKPPIS